MVDLSKFKDLYISEAEENIQLLNERMVLLEKMINSGEDETKQKAMLNDLMRASHTIKGSSASMGYLKTAYLTHVLEDVFDGARNNTLKINREIVNYAFEAIDSLTRSVSSIKKGGEEIDSSSEADILKKIAGVSTVGTGKSLKNDPSQPKEVIPVGKIAETTSSVSGQETTGVNTKAEDGKTVSDEQQMMEVAAKIEHIKVPVERLDTLLDLVEELLIDRMKLEQLSQRIPELKEVYDHMNLLISSLQYQIMQSRLVPVGQVFSRFPRMIRDLAVKLEKEIEFSINGGDIELDRTIVDKLGEPLVHLLRNAADHGIEKKGEIKLDALRENNFILISVENSGKRIDFENIKRIAINKGIIAEGKIGSLTDDQILDVLFDPQFSTKEKVTEISGRGVGLSVVKNFAETLGGKVLVESTENSAKFILKLPLTLAIINSLLVEANKTVFALPFSSIERSVLLSEQNIKRMADSEVAVVDGIKVPLVRISELFKLDTGIEAPASLPADSAPAAPESSDPEERMQTVVLIRKEKELIGVVVDSLLSEQEIIVKPLSSILKGIKGFSGSTILGDGQVILILDVNSLLSDDKKHY